MWKANCKWGTILKLHCPGTDNEGLSARKKASEQHWCVVISPKLLLLQAWPEKILGRKKLPSVFFGTEQLHRFPFRGEAESGTCHQTASGKSFCWLHLSELNFSPWSSSAARRGWESSWKSHCQWQICRAETYWSTVLGMNKLPPHATIWLHLLWEAWGGTTR